jgi:hypothetical protein
MTNELGLHIIYSSHITAAELLFRPLILAKFCSYSIERFRHGQKIWHIDQNAGILIIHICQKDALGFAFHGPPGLLIKEGP